MFPLASRVCTVIALIVSLVIGGLFHVIGVQADASLAREYKINEIYRINSHIADRLEQAAIINDWLNREVAEQARVLETRGIRHEPPF